MKAEESFEERFIGNYLSIFEEKLISKDSTLIKYYFKGGKDVVEQIIKDVEYEMYYCPKFSDLTYERLLFSLEEWQKTLNKVEEKMKESK